MPNIRGTYTINYLYHALVIATDVFAYFSGAFMKNINAILYVHLFGIVFTMILVVPPWGCWNRKTYRDADTEREMKEQNDELAIILKKEEIEGKTVKDGKDGKDGKKKQQKVVVL